MGSDGAPDEITGGTGPGGGTPCPDAPLSVQINRVVDGIRVALRGRCGGRDAGRLEYMLKDLVEGQGNRTVMFDATELVAVDADVDEVLSGVVAWATRRGTQVTVDRGRGSPPGA